MKNNRFYKKWFMVLLFLSIAILVAATIDSDFFDSSEDGWSGTNVTWDSANKRLSIDSGDTAEKTFDFNSSYANKTVNVRLNATKTNNWESSDKITISVNGTTVYNGNTGGDISFNTTLDADEKFKLSITASTDNGNEDLYIDNVYIDYNPPSPYQCSNPQEFNIAYTTNKPGNIKLIGNTNICKTDSSGQCVDPGNTANNSIDAHYKDGDTNAITFNSSSAKLELPEGAEILWAGIYWQGYYGNTPNDAIKDAARNIKLGYSADNVDKNIVYNSISATDFNWVYFNSARWYYQGFANVTDYVKSKGAGWYWGADIQMQTGTPAEGTLGAWSISIVYKDTKDTTKNLTVYKGYLALAGTTDQNNAASYAIANGCNVNNTGVKGATDIALSGFKTPL
ncbi:MAG: hypothetical protein IE881_09185, partial [Epsilonproteobacteria bacterium]|nr:hypothetical protein [Campylobacterota bacterium]